MPAKMFATALGRAEVGDLVLVEVPPNCTIHSLDAARLGRLRSLAMELRAAVHEGGPVEDIVRRIAENAYHLENERETESAGVIE